MERWGAADRRGRHTRGVRGVALIDPQGCAGAVRQNSWRPSPDRVPVASTYERYWCPAHGPRRQWVPCVHNVSPGGETGPTGRSPWYEPWCGPVASREFAGPEPRGG